MNQIRPLEGMVALSRERRAVGSIAVDLGESLNKT